MLKWLEFSLLFLLGLGTGIAVSYIFLFHSTANLSEGSSFCFWCSLPSIQESSTKQISEFSEASILMYHHIKVYSKKDSTTEASLDVSPSNFEDQVAYLYAKGYESIALDSLFEESTNKRIVITFDDGYKDVIDNALPILKRIGFQATVFLIVNNIGKDGYLSWDEIKVLEKEGWFFGSHTLNHKNLTTLSEESAKEEILESKRRLDLGLKKPVVFFAFPVGQFNEEIIKLVEDAGYQGAVTIISGKDNKAGDIYQLKRIRVSGFDTLERFIEKLK